MTCSVHENLELVLTALVSLLATHSPVLASSTGYRSLVELLQVVCTMRGIGISIMYSHYRLLPFKYRHKHVCIPLKTKTRLFQRNKLQSRRVKRSTDTPGITRGSHFHQTYALAKHILDDKLNVPLGVGP